MPGPQGVLLDQYGVLHDGQKAYPGAVAAVEALAAAGRKLLVLSNSSRRALIVQTAIRSISSLQEVTSSGSVLLYLCYRAPGVLRPCHWQRRRGRRAEQAGKARLPGGGVCRRADEWRNCAHAPGRPAQRRLVLGGAGQPLPAHDVEQARRHLARRLGAGRALDLCVDPACMCGLVVRLGKELMLGIRCLRLTRIERGVIVLD